MLTLDAGAALPWPDDALGQELLVIDGALEAGSGRGELISLARHEYCIRDHAADVPLRAVGAGTSVYVRQRLVGLAQLPELEARWWRLAEGRARLVHRGSRRWTPVSAGVEVFALWGDRDVVSMLVRFAPGASVADHHHALDEDCLVLEGEMFLGDILLRLGDYQLAPAGGGHWGETSDVGVLFFFHGALDPVLTHSPTPG
jgi:quercetin dioxygenase-like cupin family protein